MTSSQRTGNRYQSIVFLDGDGAAEPVDALYNREPGHSFPYYLGPTAESITAAFAYLAQWDNGDAGEETDEPANGTSDDTWEENGYRLTAHLGLGYVGLERIVPAPVESYRCPCCGDDVMDTLPICSDCREAGCEESTDASGESGYWECQRERDDDEDQADGDTANAMGHCRERQAAGEEISDACARVIASMYHNGGTSVGASFASTGAIIDDPSSVWGDLFDSPTGFYHAMGTDQLMADMLGTYLVRAGTRGPVEGWSGLWF
jgi:hypothetical protein